MFLTTVWLSKKIAMLLFYECQSYRIFNIHVWDIYVIILNDPLMPRRIIDHCWYSLFINSTWFVKGKMGYWICCLTCISIGWFGWHVRLFQTLAIPLQALLYHLILSAVFSKTSIHNSYIPIYKKEYDMWQIYKSKTITISFHWKLYWTFFRSFMCM